METRAKLNGVRLAPRKVRAVVRLIKRRGVQEAIDQLEHFIKRPAPTVLKLLKSGIANAENNFQMVKSNLYIKDVIVDEGIKLKRYMPKAFGRSGEIQKKTSLITIILEERVKGLKQEAPKAKKNQEVVKDVQAKPSSEPKPEIKRELGKKSSFLGGLGRKMFQRKSV